MLGVDLQPDAFHAGGRAVERLLVILRQIVCFGQPLIQFLAAGAALLGWAQRGSRRGQVALTLGTLALIADVLVYLGDRTSLY